MTSNIEADPRSAAISLADATHDYFVAENKKERMSFPFSNRLVYPGLGADSLLYIRSAHAEILNYQINRGLVVKDFDQESTRCGSDVLAGLTNFSAEISRTFSMQSNTLEIAPMAEIIDALKLYDGDGWHFNHWKELTSKIPRSQLLSDTTDMVIGIGKSSQPMDRTISLIKLLCGAYKKAISK